MTTPPEVGQFMDCLSQMERFSLGYGVLENFCEQHQATPETVAAAKNLFCAWLYAISPDHYHQFVIKQGKIGDIYTPGIAPTIEDFATVETFLPSVLRPHMIQFNDQLLAQARSGREGQAAALAEIQDGIRQHAQGLYEFFRTTDDPQWSDDLLSQFVTVVTDGGRILGIGDQGAKGAYICAGKLRCYYVGSGGAIAPKFSLPIGIDVGTNPDNYRPGRHYNGLRRERIQGEDYFDYVKLVLAAVDGLDFSLIQFEDFQGENAWEIIKWARENLKNASFNDDIEGTAAMAVEALLMVEREGINLADCLYFSLGAGGAASGMAEHIGWWIEQRVAQMIADNKMSADEGQAIIDNIHERFFFLDSVGPLVARRQIKAALETAVELLRKYGVEIDRNIKADILAKFKETNHAIDNSELARIVETFLSEHGRADVTIDTGLVMELRDKFASKEYKSFQHKMKMLLDGERYERLEKYMSEHKIYNWARVTLEHLIDCFGGDLGDKGTIVLLGTSTVPGGFSEGVVQIARKKVCVQDEDCPVVILSMSNPTAKTELLTPEESQALSAAATSEEREAILKQAIVRVYDAAQEKVLIATGSPFPAVKMGDGQVLEVAQANNIFIFPGAGLGVSLVGANKVSKKMWMAATQALHNWFIAQDDEQERIGRGALFPKCNRIQEITEAIAIAVALTAIADGEVKVDSRWSGAGDGTEKKLFEEMRGRQGQSDNHLWLESHALEMAKSYVVCKVNAA